MIRKGRHLNRRPVRWPGYWDPGYAMWTERHGGWSKREAQQIADPLDGRDLYSPEEQAADREPTT